MTSSSPPEPEPADDPGPAVAGIPDPTDDPGAAAAGVPGPVDDAADVWGDIWSEAMRAAFATLPPPVDHDGS